MQMGEDDIGQIGKGTTRIGSTDSLRQDPDADPEGLFLGHNAHPIDRFIEFRFRWHHRSKEARDLRRRRQ